MAQNNEQKQSLSAMMDAHPSCVLRIVAALKPRRPTHVEADQWARIYTVLVFKQAKGLMEKKGYDQEGRWTRRGPEPKFPLPGLDMPVIEDPSGNPIFAITTTLC
ncbi:hypothetical protein HYALB_00013423 [Hymenoscyphus albidus]|uniref:Uncharacterized protein n=1 Tax=Hymenoscyphus albidus TaxID=595503 RepID=A0A9N9PZX9_9HELO|nr:hypothetical protein HYALB_00013423 [Hymenoscyphus albidus]